MKLLSVDDSNLFFCHMVHWSFILGQGWLLSNHFVKHVKIVKIVFVQVLLCCFVVKAPANAIMHRKQRQLGQKQF